MFHSYRSISWQILQPLAYVISQAILLLVCVNSHAQEPLPHEIVPPAPSGEFSESQSTQVSKVEELWMDKPLAKVKASVKPTDGELPPKIALSQLFEQEGQTESIDIARPWFVTSCEWDAPATRHLPLLFEEPNLERLGYNYRYCYNHCDEEDQVYASECMQPLISGVHFFGRIPLIPYMLWQQSPTEPIYTLGVDRPGSPVPYRSHRLLCLRSTSSEQDELTSEPQNQSR